MIKNELASRYGRALFQLARQEDKFDVFWNNLEEISRLVEENEDLQRVFFHQKILPEEKKRVVKKIFAGEVDTHILNFVFLLIDKRRVYFIQSIIDKFRELLNEDEQILEVEVTSAMELDESLKQKLKDKLNQLLDYNLILHDYCDPSLIGGLKLKINDYVIDGSLKNKLESLREKMGNIPVSELGVEL
ncbi:MAG: ATP synthase F1 subunit delta [Bacillota bacterium]